VLATHFSYYGDRNLTIVIIQFEAAALVCESLGHALLCHYEREELRRPEVAYSFVAVLSIAYSQEASQILVVQAFSQIAWVEAVRLPRRGFEPSGR